jgi:hypothetical protein
MIVLVKELICSYPECNSILHFPTTLSDDQCRRIAEDRYDWKWTVIGDKCPKHKEA